MIMICSSFYKEYTVNHEMCQNFLLGKEQKKRNFSTYLSAKKCGSLFCLKLTVKC